MTTKHRIRGTLRPTVTEALTVEDCVKPVGMQFAGAGGADL